MPPWALHSDMNWSAVRFATTIDEVTCGSGETPPSHSVDGTGVSMSVVTVAPVLDDAAVDDDPEVDDELAVDDEPDDPHEDDATHIRPPSAAERSA